MERVQQVIKKIKEKWAPVRSLVHLAAFTVIPGDKEVIRDFLPRNTGPHKKRGVLYLFIVCEEENFILFSSISRELSGKRVRVKERRIGLFSWLLEARSPSVNQRLVLSSQ